MKRWPYFSEYLRSLWHAWGHLLVALVILMMTVVVSIVRDSPVHSIVPYGVAVALSSWRYGLIAGFLFSGLATLSALAAGAFPTRAEFVGEEIVEGFVTYLKLSVIAGGVVIAKWRKLADR